MNAPPAVFLDRDGVLSASVTQDGRPVAPARFEEFALLPGAAQALGALRQAGFKLVVVTNQPDVSSGRLAPVELERMHALMRSALPLDLVKTCVHTDDDGCACRKPKPGMILQGAAELGIDLRRSFMVGDRWRDIDAGKAAGCRTILIGDGYGERVIRANWTVKSLPEAVRLILAQKGTAV